MSPAAHGAVVFRASPRLYRGKVLVLALAIAVVSVAEALQTGAREGAPSAGLERIECIVPGRAHVVVVVRGGGAPVAPEAALGETAGLFADRLAATCSASGHDARSLRLAPRASLRTT